MKGGSRGDPNALSEEHSDINDLPPIDKGGSPLTPLNKGGKEIEEENNQNLLLIPHRDLHRLPLHYFFPNYTCTYLPSAYFALELERRSSTNLSPSSPILLVANPTIESEPENKKWQSLAFADLEAAQIKSLFSQLTAMENHQADKNPLIQNLSQPHHIFHFTGHGYYNSNNPKESCLVLKDGAKFTLLDIIRLNLTPYELVTLAACETGVTGNQTITDEYVGLGSAFLYTGVSSVLTSLWPIQSEPTTILILEFYRQLLGGKNAPTALKSAQTWLQTASKEQLTNWLHNLDPLAGTSEGLLLTKLIETLDRKGENCPYAALYYWAGFTLLGSQEQSQDYPETLFSFSFSRTIN